MQAVPWIAARHVQASKRWYQQLLRLEDDGLPYHPHREEFDQLFSAGRVVLAFHAWDAEPELPLDRWLQSPDVAPLGRGVVLSFSVDDFNAAVVRAREMSAELIEDVFAYPNGVRALMLRDPDGYALVLTD
jgi:hypothetical protein